MSRNSESGYSSDECQTRSPSNHVINKDAKIFAQRYSVEEELMKSANGVLYTGFDVRSGKPVVIKQIPRDVVGEYKIVDGRMIPSEIYYHVKSSELSKSVVKPLDWFERRSSFVLVMEKPENSIDLFEFSQKYGSINEDAAKVIWKQIVECAQKLYNGGVIHRDIKDENILINPETLEIKLIDFGCASKKKSVYRSCRGTPEFWPIEWYEQHIYEPEPLTVWSLGSVLYILLTGEWEFENGNHIRNFKSEVYLSTDAKNLINYIFCSNSSKQANFDQILKSKWLNC